jgi:hypothetical protein
MSDWREIEWVSLSDHPITRDHPISRFPSFPITAIPRDDGDGGDCSSDHPITRDHPISRFPVPQLFGGS